MLLLTDLTDSTNLIECTIDCDSLGEKDLKESWEQYVSLRVINEVLIVSWVQVQDDLNCFWLNPLVLSIGREWLHEL